MTAVRKNVSLFPEQFKVIESLTSKHEGNMSSTLREIIDFAGIAIEKFGSLEKAKEHLYVESAKYNRNSIRPGDKLVLRVESIISDKSDNC